MILECVFELRLAIPLEDPEGQESSYDDEVDFPAALPPFFALVVPLGLLLRPCLFIGQCLEDTFRNCNFIELREAHQCSS